MPSDILKLNYRPANEFYQMELLGDYMTMVAVPSMASEQLKLNILAGMKAANMGLSSIDYTKKRYGERWTFPNPPPDEVKLISYLDLINDEVHETIESICNEKPRPELLGLLVAEHALVRLKATFSATLILLRQGYPFEAAALCRLIMEQLSWAYCVAPETDREVILAIPPQSTLTSFKSFLPSAGRLYGRLSSVAHMMPKENRHYVSHDGSGTIVRFYLPEETKTIVYYSLLLTDAYVRLVTHVSGTYLSPRQLERRDWRLAHGQDETAVMPYVRELCQQLGLAPGDV